MMCVHTIAPGRAVTKNKHKHLSLPERDGVSTFNGDGKEMSGKLACIVAG